MKELLHLCDRSDQFTIFENLKVLDLRREQDLIGRREVIDGSWRRIVVAIPKPKITKSDGSRDRRYSGWWNDDAQTWPLLRFIDRMGRIADEGDITDPDHVWKEASFRPAFIHDGMVFMPDFRLLPIYMTGGFGGFLQNLIDLHELAKELLDEATSR